LEVRTFEGLFARILGSQSLILLRVVVGDDRPASTKALELGVGHVDVVGHAIGSDQGVHLVKEVLEGALLHGQGRDVRAVNVLEGPDELDQRGVGSEEAGLESVVVKQCVV
jgi:hypothetical protein